MPHFAEIDENNIVKQVIVADQEFINSGKVGDPKNWIETFKDRSQRKNYAKIGGAYDSARDAFISPKPYASWLLDEETCRWVPPIPMPPRRVSDFYTWDEKIKNWKKTLI